MPSLGPRLPLSPPPCLLPPEGDGPVCRWPALLWNCSVLPLFCERVAVCSVSAFHRLIFSLSLLLSHSLSCYLTLAPSECSQAIGPVLTLSTAACSSPSSPHLLVVDASVLSTILLGVVFRHVIGGFYLFFLPVGCPLRFENFPQTRQWESFLVFGNFLYYDCIPGMDLRPWLYCLSFYLLYLSYLLSKTMGCFSGCLMSSASNQKLFCGVCSAFKWSFNEFVGDKVFSPSYSSAILVPSQWPPF